MSQTEVAPPDERSRAERRLLAGPPASARGPRSWLYALATTNPPPGEADLITKVIVVTRAAVLPMTLGAGLVAGLLAFWHGGVDVVDLLLAVLGILLAHTSNNLSNDLFDSAVGSDTAGYPRLLYAPHPVLSGLISKRGLIVSVLGCELVGVAIGIYLITQRGPLVAVFAVAGFVLSLFYTAPPLRLKKRGLGEPDVFLVWGPLMVGGTYFSATGHLPWHVLLAALPYGVLCTTVLMGKHIDKIPYDEPAGTRTLPVILGERRARRATQALLVSFYVLIAVGVALSALPWPTLLVVLGIPRLIAVLRAFSAPRPDEPPKNFPVWPLWFAAVAFLHVRRAGALLVAGLALGLLT